MTAARLAVIGAGHWHMERQVDAFRAAGAEIVGVQDSVPATSEGWSRRLHCPAFTDVGQLLETSNPNLVLAMPVHAETPAVLSELVDRGLPFVVEKPAAATASDLWPVVEAAERAGLFTAVAFINRYGAFWSELERLRQQGALHRIGAARFRIINGTPDRYRDDQVGWVLDPRNSGGGALRNLGSHAADALLQLASGDWQVIGATTSDHHHGLEVEEYCVAVLRHANGIVATVEAGYILPSRDGTDQEWTVTGPDGVLTETDTDLRVVLTDRTASSATVSVGQRYRKFAANALQRWHSGEPSATPLRDAAEAAALIDRIYRAVGENPVAADRVVDPPPAAAARPM